MAAARQKEMNVSITDEATMSRTRLLGGATVVLEEAIAWVPARQPVVRKRYERNHRSAPSLILNQGHVNGK